ncbi:DUF2213 domain-containing protein [Chryseobacterium sp.]|uniref:DUF2213 domain-containing protein n=1 Tax=Chryseobacterium sp. TaxID=1871047 RepID=UPI00321B4DC4
MSKRPTPAVMAMDKQTVDSYGRLHVDVSNITKSGVNPYYGREIPKCMELGLDPDRVYFMLRDPEELRQAAAGFNGIQLLVKHDPRLKSTIPLQDQVVGTLGTDAEFDEPYLRNSLSVWEHEAILGIRTKTKYELSAGYGYDADMTPGVYGGVKYDGVMRNLRPNHVALVFEGRAGPDVVVGDSKLKEQSEMKLSPKGVALLGALLGYSATVIAMDEQISGELRTIAGGIKDLKTAKERKAVIKAYSTLADGKIKEGMALDGLDDVVSSVAEADTDIPAAAGAMDGADYGTRLAALLEEGGMTPEVITKIQALCAGGAMDEAPPAPPPKKEDDVDTPAMDAAIDAAVKANTAKLMAVRQAEIEVQPVIGALSMAMDDASEVYKVALTQMQVDLTDVDPSAYRSVFRAVHGKAATAAPAPTKTAMAMDAKMEGGKTFAEMFPGANKVTGS